VTRRSRKLRNIDPLRRRSVVYRLYAALLGTRLLGWVSRRVVWKLDPLLLSLTRGHLGMGMGLPTALLETRGARSGERRRNAVIYFHDRERVIVVASKLGLPAHPAWLHNLRANPDVALGGQPFTAQVVEDEAERQRLWMLADRVFPPYASYRARAARVDRTIPIVQLTPR
jgi:deazaflavin-dependent oxidoreductase (nitroreductase family)